MSGKKKAKRTIKVSRSRKSERPKSRANSRITPKANQKRKLLQGAAGKRKPKPKPKKPNVDVWTAEEDKRVREALERASREFDDSDSLNVHTIEAIYGQDAPNSIWRLITQVKAGSPRPRLSRRKRERIRPLGMMLKIFSAMPEHRIQKSRKPSTM